MGGHTLKQLPLRRSLGGSGGVVHSNSYLYRGLWEVVGGRTVKQLPSRRSLGGSGGSYTKTVTFTDVSGR